MSDARDRSPAHSEAAARSRALSDVSLDAMPVGAPATFELAGTGDVTARYRSATRGADGETTYNATLAEDVKVYPSGALPASKIALRKPDFDGPDAFNQLKQALYARAESKDGGAAVKFDLRVQEGEIGYFCDRGGGLHLLKPGRHLRLPGSLDSALYACSLNRNEVHLPPPDLLEGGTQSNFHIIRVNPGEFVCARQAGRPVFLQAGTDGEGFPVPGYHLIEEDRTLEIIERVDVTRPVIQNGSSFIVNVPPGYYCKAMIARTPLLLGAGQHQINVSQFSVPSPDTAFVNVNEVYIEHGIIHIIRVSPNQKFKAMMQGQAVMLDSRAEPYVFNDPTFRIAEASIGASFVNTADKYIEHQTIHDVKLDLGEVALCWLENRPLILGSAAVFGRAAIEEYGIDVPTDDPTGRHYKFVSPNFRMVKDKGKAVFMNIGEQQCVRHGTVYVLRVRQGELCRVWEGSKPVILLPKDEPYVYNSSVFRLASPEKDGYPAFISQSEKVIEHGTHHIITVPSGQVCLVWHDGHARILGSELVSVTLLGPPGSVPTFSKGAEGSGDVIATPASTGTSASATLSRYDDSEEIRPVTGRRYEIESSNFRLASKEVDGYDAWAFQSSKCIRHGSVGLITVEDGEVAVVRNNGKRQALGPGRYRLEAPQQVFEKHLYTGVRTTEPEEIVTYDSQRIPIRVKFTVTYEIQDPSKAAQYKGKESEGDGSNDLDIFLRTACHSCLRASVNHTHILDMGKGGELKRLKEMQDRESREKTAAESGEAAPDAGAAAFADQFHVAFEHQNHTLITQLERVGVALIDLSIQDWTIDDPKVVTQLESLAMQTVEAQVSNAQNQSLAIAAKLSAEGRAASEIAKANGDAAVTQARIDAENTARLSKARTLLASERIEAEAREVKAKAEAEAILIRAEAESKAIELRGAAEALAKESKLSALSYTPSAEWMRQLQEACATTLSGAKLTIAPEGLSNLYALLNTASPVFSGMRQPYYPAVTAGGAGGDVAAVPEPVTVAPPPVPAPAPAPAPKSKK